MVGGYPSQIAAHHVRGHGLENATTRHQVRLSNLEPDAMCGVGCIERLSKGVVTGMLGTLRHRLPSSCG